MHFPRLNVRSSSVRRSVFIKGGCSRRCLLISPSTLTAVCLPSPTVMPHNDTGPSLIWIRVVALLPVKRSLCCSSRNLLCSSTYAALCRQPAYGCETSFNCTFGSLQFFSKVVKQVESHQVGGGGQSFPPPLQARYIKGVLRAAGVLDRKTRPSSLSVGDIQHEPLFTF